MNVHKNARTTAHSRAELVRRVLSQGQSLKTVHKWVERFVAEGPAGLADRSSRPHKLNRPTPPQKADQIIRLRRQRWTGEQIARETGVSPATVSRVLRRAGLSRMKDLEPAEPVVRYERQHAGELIHLDIKKLARFDKVGHRITGDGSAGESRGARWEFVHVCIDDASRLAFSRVLPNEKQESAVAFLKAAVAYYASLGVIVARVMTDTSWSTRRSYPAPLSK